MSEQSEGLRVSLYEAAMTAAIKGDDEWAGNYLRALAPLEPEDEEPNEVAMNTAEMLMGDAIDRGYLEVIEADSPEAVQFKLMFPDVIEA